MLHLDDPLFNINNNNDYSIKILDVDNISEGYVYSGTDEFGSMRASPDQYTFSNLNKFSENIFDTSLISSSPLIVNYLTDEYNSTLNSMGISSDPSKGDNFRPIGVESSGRELFSTQNMITSKDFQFGSKMVKASTDVLKGFDLALNTPTFDNNELLKLKSISDNSQDPVIIQQLDTSKSFKDSEGFIDKIFDYFAAAKTKVTNKASKQGKGAKGDEDEGSLLDSLSTAYDAYALFENWDYLSPAQKAAGLATVGLKGYELAGGEKLGKKILVDATLKADGSILTPALTVGDALDLFSLGVNAYGLAKNWDQLSDISKVASGIRTVASITKVAKNLNLLGYGATNASVNISQSILSMGGYSAAPQFGVGAIVGPASSGIPAGYTAVAYADDVASGVMMSIDAAALETGRQVVAVPAGTAASAQGVASGAGSMLQTGAGYAGIAAGAYTIYEGWGTGGEQGVINGAVGGASMATGLYLLGYINPYFLAAVVIVSALSGLVKTGKHKDQVARDGVRSRFKEVGIVDDNWNVSLADGTKVDIGVDGQDNLSEWLDPVMAEELGGDPNSKLRAYDVDYTNDVIFAASLGGVTLARIVSGGSGIPAVDQMGGQLANAVVSNVDFQDGNLTEEKYYKIMANYRSVYASSGIKTKSDAWALTNQLYAENRINDTELVQMQQALHMIYEPDRKISWRYAQEIFEGRSKGMEVANEKKDIPERKKKAKKE